jgi:hypothetical protein
VALHDPMMAVLTGKLGARREDCAPVAGKSTLNRLELSKLEPTPYYHKVSHNATAIKRLLVDVFLEAHKRAPNELTPLTKPTSIAAGRLLAGIASAAMIAVVPVAAQENPLRQDPTGRESGAPSSDDLASMRFDAQDRDRDHSLARALRRRQSRGSRARAARSGLLCRRHVQHHEAFYI